MNRRSFLGVLLASLGATAIEPKTLLWSPTPEAATVIEPSAILTLNQITMQMLHEIRRIHGGWVATSLDNDLTVGSTIDGNVMNHQYSVGMEFPKDIDKHGLDKQRYIIPAAEAIAHRLGNIKACGKLPLPNGAFSACIAHDSLSGLALRGLHQGVFDPILGDVVHQLRFDMLVAA